MAAIRWQYNDQRAPATRNQTQQTAVPRFDWLAGNTTGPDPYDRALTDDARRPVSRHVFADV